MYFAMGGAQVQVLTLDGSVLPLEEAWYAGVSYGGKKS